LPLNVRSTWRSSLRSAASGDNLCRSGAMAEIDRVTRAVVKHCCRTVGHYSAQQGAAGDALPRTPGGKHQFMVQGDITTWIPNAHQGDIGRELLARIVRQAPIDRDAWEKLWGCRQRRTHISSLIIVPEKGYNDGQPLSQPKETFRGISSI
jgi:hypothetical protein